MPADLDLTADRTTISVDNDRLNPIERLRLVIVSAAIALMVFAQSSGMVAADTKLDLVVDPARFLQRAMTLWDSTGNSGQLQDQAYGYLFPMGPFFLLGKLISLDPWVIQRCWESALLIGAFLGVRRLARLLGVTGFWPCVVAGASYALAPRMLSELFSISAELLPVAALPWVLIPLVTGSRSGSTRTAAMRSGAALLLAGGINASATLAILPIPALWLLSRQRGERRASLIRWWALAVLLSCLWWLIPLLTLGKYSPPFLNWIESSAVTTSQNSFIAVARGADHWQAYLGPNVWPAGWIYAVAPAAIVATALVAAIGFAGLALPKVPHRWFLVSSLLIGFVLLSMGHSASIDGPFSGQLRQLLDGPLSAFRNIHKFDPVVRLPLAIGVGHLASSAVPVTRTLATRLAVAQRRFVAPIAVLIAVSVAAVALSPALGNYLVQQPRSTTIAGYWPQAAQWLAAHQTQGRALVVPGAGRPEMVWGSTIDEPMQPVARSPWAVRETVPLGQAGYVRYLDEIELMLSTGTPQPGLAALLGRGGFGYLVIRADLVPTADATNLGLVMSTIRQSPGLTAVQSFGPVQRDTGASNRLIDSGLGNGAPAIQILRIGDGTQPVSLLDADHAVLANGSADQLPSLIADGLSASSPVLFGSDAAPVAAADPTTVLTDGLRKREITFGHPGPIAATMTSGQPYQNTRAVHDYLPDNAGTLSTMQYEGIADVRASSAGSDVAAFVNRGADHSPWYALDGDPSTAWLSGSAAGAVGQWFELRLTAAVINPVLTIQFPENLGDFPTALEVRTDSGTTRVEVTPDAEPQRLQLPPGTTQSVRLTVAALASGTKGVATGFASVSLAGVEPQRSLQVPSVSSPQLIDFQAADGFRTGCAALAQASACLPALARTGEEQAAISRSFSLAAAADYAASAQVQLVAGTALDGLLDAGSDIAVTASSTAGTDPRQRPGAVVDGLAGTTWSAAAGDSKPELSLRFSNPRTVSSLVVQTAADAPVSTPSQVRVTAGGESWTVPVGDGGLVPLPQPVTTSELAITVLKSDIKISTDSITRNSVILPVGISELEVNGLANAANSSELASSCADGPALIVDGRVTRLSVSGSREIALAGGELQATPCGATTVALDAGPHQISLASSAETVVLGLTLQAGSGLPRPTPETAPRVTSWGDSHRSVAITSTDRSLLVVHENFNAGWQATVAGHRLTAVRVDGWQQAFVVPAGTSGTVTLTYAPDKLFRIGLVLGLLAVLLLLVLAFVPVGRSGRSGRSASPALGDGRAPRWLATAGVVVALLALAGPIGLALGVAGWGLWQVRRPRPALALPAVAAVAITLAGLLNAIGPSVSAHPLTDSWLAQGCVVLAIVALALAALVSPDRD